GVFQHAVTLRFGDGSLRTVNVALVLRAGGGAAAAKAPAAAGCAPAKLVLLFTSVATDFNVAAAWPSPIEMKIVDDCGEPLSGGSNRPIADRARPDASTHRCAGASAHFRE